MSGCKFLIRLFYCAHLLLVQGEKTELRRHKYTHIKLNFLTTVRLNLLESNSKLHTVYCLKNSLLNLCSMTNYMINHPCLFSNTSSGLFSTCFIHLGSAISSKTAQVFMTVICQHNPSPIFKWGKKVIPSRGMRELHMINDKGPNHFSSGDHYCWALS